MILQALNDYYERKMADPDPARRLAAFGFEYKEIPFIIEIDRNGKLITIKDTRNSEEKRKVAAKFLVPKGVKKTSGVAANLLWDTAEYVLALDSKGKPERVNQQHAAFVERLKTLPATASSDAGICAVLQFLATDPLAQAQNDPCWNELRETNPLMTFRLADDVDLVCQRPAIAAVSAIEDAASVSALVCLVSGEKGAPERLHSAIKGVWGAQTAGANIVSFNLDAFRSFGKEQGANAPVSRKVAFGYTTALNHLLSRGSRQRLQVGDSSTVFWAQKADDVEDVFAELFGDNDDPDARTERIRALLESVHAGKFDAGRDDNSFFVLGLAPNAARISVRFWHAAPLSAIGRRIREWFDDISIARGPADPEYPSLFRLLTACAVQGKADNIPPNLGGDVMRAVLSGGPFPTTWLGAAIRRCRAERRVTYLRAAAIKACLNRSARYSSNQEELKPMLDTNNINTAYRLGRLFSVLEKIQEEANPGINTTIRERFYGAASSTPVAVFTTLLRLKNHHIAKLDNRGRATNFEKLLGEIVAGVSKFPAHLTLPDQGHFALGYYHQRQAFFTKPE